jgi:hypothetical protein
MHFVSAALVVTAVVATAQAPSPPGPNSPVPETLHPAVAAVRARLGQSLAVADRTVTFQWLSSLTELERRRASAGDYEGAQRVRLRGEQALAAAGTDDGRSSVPLLVGDSTNKGTGLSVNESQTTAEFRTKGAFLEWDMTGAFGGWYEVMLTHGVMGGKDQTAEISPVIGPIPKHREDSDSEAAPTGGWVAFQNMSNLGAATVLRREIVSTGGWNSWRTVSLGRIQMPDSRLAKFRLTGEEVAKRGLMHFRQLELIPVSAPASAAVAGEDKLTGARVVFEKEFRSRVSVNSTGYRSALASLEQQAIRTKDNDLLYRVREEVKRLAETPEKLALSSDAELAALPAKFKLTVGDSFSCQRRGDIKLDSGSSTLTQLRPAGTAAIIWRLSAFNVVSGVYEVEIDCRVPLNGGGGASLGAFGAANAPAGPALKFDVKPVVLPENKNKPLASGEPAPSAEKRTEEPGKIIIGKNAESLILSINSLVHSNGSLMDITSLKLTRIGDVPPEKKGP